MLGKILGGRYQIISHLGGGGFGSTFVAEDRHLPGTPRCVVKQFKPRNTDSLALQMARGLFNREAEVLYQLGTHDQIPRLFAHFQEDEEFYLVQELIEGYELRQELQPDQPFNEQQVIALLRDTLEVLNFVHQQNVIHRDIKPSNLIRRRSDGKLVLIDFGAVKQLRTQVIDPQGYTSFTMAIGSPGYMPSEQLAGKPRFCSDIYAVGMLAIQALTGVHPMQLPEDPNSCEIVWCDRAQVNPKLVEILNKMVRYDFRQRYQSTAEVLSALYDISSISLTPVLPIPRPVEDDNITSLPTQTFVSDNLTSEQGVDYRRLRDLLAAGKWKEADRETAKVMLRVAGRENEGWLDIEYIEQFPCEDLRTIDQLWVKYSNGRFGFSVQKRIWLEAGGKPGVNDQQVWEKFGDRVGWRMTEGAGWRMKKSWLNYSNLTFSHNAPLGHLPWVVVGFGPVGRGGWFECLFSRAETCKLHAPILVTPNVKQESPTDDFSSELKVSSPQSRQSSIRSRIEVVEGDITKLQVDAIVNPTDRYFSGTGVVDFSIHRAAGPQLRKECLELLRLNGFARSEAKITKGYNLPVQWIIHTVGPFWRGGNEREDQILAQCYQNCLALAEQYSIRTIAFPAISTGALGFPMELASRIAVKEVSFFLTQNTSVEKVILVGFGKEAYKCYLTNLHEIVDS